MSLVEKKDLINQAANCGCVPNLKCSKCSTLLCVHLFRTHQCGTKIARNRPL
ncbi:MAG: hypothetical protein ACXACX_01390 [Candidatus Hodarchaeales archaeon]|jgi:hypothetical protein